MSVHDCGQSDADSGNKARNEDGGDKNLFIGILVGHASQGEQDNNSAAMGQGVQADSAHAADPVEQFGGDAHLQVLRRQILQCDGQTAGTRARRAGKDRGGETIGNQRGGIQAE